MAIKSVLDVDVNDSAFRQFVSLYEKYQEQLKKSPDLWKKVKQEVEGVSAAAAKAPGAGRPSSGASPSAARTTATAEDSRAVQTAAHRQVATTHAIREQKNAWHEMAKSSKDFSHNITTATRFMLRWAGITTLMGGLLGAGGLFGFAGLASSAGNLRRSSLGMGVTPGEKEAFEVNYKRVVDPDQFLTGVNQSMHDVTKRQALTAAGLTNKDIDGKDTFDVATTLIGHLKDIADKTDPRVLDNVYRARHMDQFMTEDAFQRLRATPRSEIGEYTSSANKDRKALSIPDQQLEAWQKLQTKLSRAGTMIENTFITGLANLAGPIGKLSSGFTDLVTALVKSPQVKIWIDDLANGLETFAKYIDTPQFKTDMLDFVTGVGHIATAIGSAVMAIAGWVNWFQGKSVKDVAGAIKKGGVNGPIGNNLGSPGSEAFDKAHGIPYGGGAPNGYSGYDNEKPGWMNRKWDHLETWWKSGSTHFSKSHTEAMNRLEANNGLPKGLLSNVEWQESGGRDVTSPKGAQGTFQFMPGTAKRYGVNVHDEMSSAEGAGQYLRDLVSMFHGNIRQAVASYDWGQGNVKADIEAHGKRWKDYMPDETKQYVANVMSSIRSQGQQMTRTGQGIAVMIHNNTGGNATVTTAQLAH